MSRVLARIGAGIVTVLLVVTLAFLLLEFLPGDPLGLASELSIPAEEKAELERLYGLDRPPLERYWDFVGHALRGDLGISLRYQAPVSRVLLDALGPTLLLTCSGMLIAFSLGIVLGTMATLRPRGIVAFVVARLLPALDALPPFWLGLVAIWLVAWKLGWLPASHMTSPGTTSFDLADVLRHLLLPALVVGLPGVAHVARHHAAALERAWNSLHTRAARALGVSERRLLLRATRCALHPIIALLGLILPTTVGGVVVVEVVFSWPGLGRLHQEALLARDIPLVLGGLLLISVAVVVGSLLADLLSGWVDPRWRAGGVEPRP